MSSRIGQPRGAQAAVLKWWLPLLATGALSMIFRHSTIWQVLWVIPVACLIFFYITSAQIHAEDGLVRYRRFFNWRQIPTEQVIAIGYSLFPGLGQIRLDHYLLPWGHLYYVMEQDPKSIARILHVRAYDQKDGGEVHRWQWAAACAGVAGIAALFWVLIGSVCQFGFFHKFTITACSVALGGIS